MNLQPINAYTLPPIRTKGDDRPLLTFNPKSGVIRFNQSAVRSFKLKTSSVFSFHQDADKPADWYVEFNPEAGGYHFQKKAEKTSLSFGHRELARLLSEIVKIEGTVEIPIGPKDPATGLHPLITKAAALSITAKRRTGPRKKETQAN